MNLPDLYFKREELNSKLQLIEEKKGINRTKAEISECHSIINRIDEITERMHIKAIEEGWNKNKHSFEEFMKQPTSKPYLENINTGMSNRAGLAPDAKYRSMFPDVSLSNDGFRNFQEFCEAASAGNHPNLRSMSEGVPAEGGFMVPTEYVAEILDVSLESEIVRPRARIYPMGSSTKKISGHVIGDHSDNLYGGLIGYWIAEKGSIGESAPRYRGMELNAQKLGIFGVATGEVEEDALGFGGDLQRMFTNGAGWFLDRAFLKGDGAGKPQGVMNSPAMITVAKETNQPASTIKYENLTKMFARMYAGSLQNAVWICHQTTIPQLLSLTITVGAGGAHIPVLSESGGRFTMLTKPVIFTEKTEPLGTKGDIMLVDLSQYAIGMRKDARFEKSIHVYFQTDRPVYRLITRCDGQSLWDEVLTLEDGTNTVSPYVTLAAR